LEDFFKAKNIRCKNEMLDDSATLLAARLDPEELATSEEEAVGGARGSADEDEESVDEDFQADSESDVAEEYDSAHESEGSGSGASDAASDAEMPDADGASDEEDKRPKKKTKT
jgi:structure-specific recognition protein 1